MILNYRLHLESQLDDLLLEMQESRINLENHISNSYSEHYLDFVTNTRITLEKGGANNESKSYMLNQKEIFLEVSDIKAF